MTNLKWHIIQAATIMVLGIVICYPNVDSIYRFIMIGYMTLVLLGLGKIMDKLK